MLNDLNNIRMAQVLQHIHLALRGVLLTIVMALGRFLQVDCLHCDHLPRRLVQRAPNDAEPAASQSIAELVVEEDADGRGAGNVVAVQEPWSWFSC